MPFLLLCALALTVGLVVGFVAWKLGRTPPLEGAQKVGETIGRQRTTSTTDDQMKANVEPGIFAREERSLLARGCRDHQAGRSQDALVMRAKNPGVDFARIAEVISGDDNGSGRGR